MQISVAPDCLAEVSVEGVAGAQEVGKSISYKNSSKFYANLLLKQKLLPICLGLCAKLQMYAKYMCV